MKLWNDYEGKILDGQYTLGALVRPEGRSALFNLASGPGAPAMIRVTESLNDEGEMLATWRRITALGQPELLAIPHAGNTVFEGTPITFAVLEATDANLDDLLAERPLTQAEALQVATAVVAGLSSLHGENLVHEHVDAANVFAVGETVKLRADCARPSVVDHEFVTAEDHARLIRKDVHDLGAMLLRALTLEGALRPGLELPVPFDRVVPRALDGSWTLEKIAEALHPPAKPVPAAAALVSPAAVAAALPRAVEPAAAAPAQASLPYPEAAALAGQAEANPLRFQRRIEVPALEATGRLPQWAPLALAAALLVALALFLVHGSSAAKPASSAAAAVAAPQTAVLRTTAQEAAVETLKSHAVPVAAGASETEAGAAEASRVRPGWYVIAYTFHHEEQALKRAAALVRRYPGLHPQVIAPDGSAYMVALGGGALSRDQAEAIRNHARRAGLPRDTFVRNYGS